MNKMNPVSRLGVGLLTTAMIATSGVATAAVSSGLSPVMAYAYDTQNPPTGLLTVNQSANAVAEYDAFKIFDADVVKAQNATTNEDEYRATHMTWTSNDVMTAVLNGTTGNATPFSDDSDSDTYTDYVEWLADKYQKSAGEIDVTTQQIPQNAAEYIAYMIKNSAEADGTNTDPETKQANSFAARLSKTLYAAGLQPDATIHTGNAEQLTQGYWLVTTDDATIANGEAGTAPIWAAVSSTPLVISAKEAIPQIDKYVKDNTDDTTNFAKIADAGIGENQNLAFKVESVLPENVDAFDTYSVTITDTLPEGMDLQNSNLSSVAVTLNGTDIKGALSGQVGSIAYQNGVLTVTINNVKDETALGVDAHDGGTIVITYNAHMTDADDVNIGSAEGNVNTAVLSYSADPNDSSLMKTVSSTANTLTYAVEIQKVDKVTRLNLQGAGFTASTQINGTTYYVMEDGTLSTDANDAYEFFTDANGLLTISGLDEGTYVLTETTAPANYELIDQPVTLVIDAVKDGASGTLTSLSASVSGGEGTFVNGIVASDAEDGIKSYTTSTGLVQARLSDDRIVVLPLTGMKIRDAALLGGVAIAIASSVAYVVSKKNKEEE